MNPFLKVTLFFMLLWGATCVAKFFYPALDNLLFYLLVSGIASWYLLRAEGRTIWSLNLYPRKKEHFRQLSIGVLMGAVLLLCTAVITNLLTGQHWVLSGSFEPLKYLIAFLFCFLSVFVQEFAFRGYAFQTLLNHYGKWTAQLFIMLPFGLMHLHWNMSIEVMIEVMLSTGLGSLFFGEAYIRTRSLCLPIALHLGWNAAQMFIPRHISQNGTSFIEVSTGSMKSDDIIFWLPYFPVVIAGYLLLHYLKWNWLMPVPEVKSV